VFFPAAVGGSQPGELAGHRGSEALALWSIYVSIIGMCVYMLMYTTITVTKLCQSSC
jgi:hypothetical protein